MRENIKQSTWIRILIFALILFVSSMIGIAVSALFMFSGNTGMKISQGLSSILMFVVPPIVYYFVTRREHQMVDLGFRKLNKPWLLYLLIGIAVMFVSMPVTNLLTTWNEGMKLGGTLEHLESILESLTGKSWEGKLQQIEDIIRLAEDKANETINGMLNVDTVGGLLFNLLVIALIPAIGEELTFRGLLQQSLTRSLKNPHIAIILSAAIFSYIHFQFYGFLPRMFLGILLGYMFYTSGSLWTSMLMHFLNNGSAVVVYYLNNKGIIDVDIDHFGSTENVWILVASALATAGLIVWSCLKKKQDLKV